MPMTWKWDDELKKSCKEAWRQTEKYLPADKTFFKMVFQADVRNRTTIPCWFAQAGVNRIMVFFCIAAGIEAYEDLGPLAVITAGEQERVRNGMPSGVPNRYHLVRQDNNENMAKLVCFYHYSGRHGISAGYNTLPEYFNRAIGSDAWDNRYFSNAEELEYLPKTHFELMQWIGEWYATHPRK